MAALWFALSVMLPNSNGWTDHTMIVEIHELAHERNISYEVIKSQG